MLKEIAEDLSLSNPNIKSEDFENLLKSSKLWLYEWGVIFAVENSMHIHVMSSWRKKVFLRKYLRQVANEMFKSYEELTTSILKDKPFALEFDLRIGWKLFKETDDMWILKMSKKDFKYAQ